MTWSFAWWTSTVLEKGIPPQCCGSSSVTRKPHLTFHIPVGVLAETLGAGRHRLGDRRERPRRLLDRVAVVVDDAPSPGVPGRFGESQNVHAAFNPPISSIDVVWRKRSQRSRPARRTPAVGA